MERYEFKCSIGNCQKVYSNPFNLKRHKESFHQGLKKFFCDICNKGLSSKQNLREHINIHLGAKPYSCNYKDCKQSYRQASQLTLHQNMHIEVEKFLQSNKLSLSNDVLLLTNILTKTKSDNQDTIKFSPIVERITLPPINIGTSSNLINTDQMKTIK